VQAKKGILGGVIGIVYFHNNTKLLSNGLPQIILAYRTYYVSQDQRHYRNRTATGLIQAGTRRTIVSPRTPKTS
jgi:hypothetical protein